MIRGLPRRSAATRLLASAAVVGGALALTFSGAFATLTANATGTSSVQSGTLLLALTADGSSNGLPETITTMAPGDVYNVYVNLNNTGSLASAAGMTLGWSATPSTALTDGSITGEGLSVAITQCSAAWTIASGTCNGTTTNILASTILSATNPVNLSNVPSLAATTGSLAHLQFSLSLAGTESSTNGTLPSPSIQGLGPVTITWTFTETQRAGTTTNN